MKTLLFASAAAILAVTAAHAETAVEVDQLVVTANRAPTPVDRVGAQITVVDAATIARTQAVVASDLITRTPGVTFTRNGPVGSQTSVRIRGAEGDQTVVLIDGVKLNDPSQVGGGYNFGNLLVGDLSRIEVLRGPQSVLWGSQAIGGVVNLITADPQKPFESQLDAEVGSQHTAYLRAGVGGKSDQLVWRLAAAHFTTDGFSAFAPWKGGREDDGFRQTGVNGKLLLNVTEQLSVEARGLYTKGRIAFDGFPPPTYAFGDTAEYGEREEMVGYLGANLALLDGRFHNRLGYAYTREDSDNFDPTQAVTDRTFDSRGTNGRWEYQGTFDVNDAWRAVFGAESERSTIRNAAPSSFDPNPTPLRKSATLNGVYGQLQVRPARGLTLAAGVRRDDHDTFGEATVGQVSAAYALNGDSTILRASWGQGFKAPSLYQLYSEYGNATLDPEEADAWDAGIEQRFLGGLLSVSAAYFSRDAKNQIDFFSCPFGPSSDPLCTGAGGLPRFGYYANTAKAEARGVELQASVNDWNGLTASANYTYTDTENTSAGSPSRGKALARRPKDTANLIVDYAWPMGLNTGLSLRYVGKSFDDAANRNRLKAYTLADVRMSWSISEQIEVYGRVENLFDEEYETAVNYGGLGRTAAIGLRGRF
jgi:vitamin B12 transporter